MKNGAVDIPGRRESSVFLLWFVEERYNDPAVVSGAQVAGVFCGKKREGSTWLTFFNRRYIFKSLFFTFPVSSSMERHLADKGVLGDK